MPKPKQDEVTPGQIEPSFHWETRIPHTVVLMLKSTEEDLILKACQSLYKFAHEGDLNQNLLVQYDVLVLLLDHLEHANRNVRRMSAMTLSELSANNAVQSVLMSEENVVRLVRVLREDDDCVVDEVAGGALLRLAADAAGRALLLRCEAVDALVKRLGARDPDVLKNCLDALLVLLDYPEGARRFVEGAGVPSALELLASEYPTLQSLALEALRKATGLTEGRASLRDVGGMAKLLALLESPKLEDLHSSAVSVLDGAISDIESIHAIHEVGGLVKILAFVQTSGVPDVLEQCAFLLAKMAQHADVREIFHELGAEPVIVSSLLTTGHAGSQNGAARAIGHMCAMLEAQEELVRLDAVPVLLGMVASPETFQAAVVALAAATSNHQRACRQISGSDRLSQLVDRLVVSDEEAVSHAAVTLRNLAEQETERPIVAASGAPARLVDCLADDSPVVLVSVCDALEVLCLNRDARREVVDGGGAELFMRLLEHEEADVRAACVRALQVVGADFRAAQQLSSGGAIGSLRRLRATSTLKIVLEVNLSALYSIFGRLSARHRLYDTFFDCGRQLTCDAVPELAALLEEPLSRTRLVYLVDSGVCPYRGDPQPHSQHRHGERRRESAAKHGAPEAAAAGGPQQKLVTERPPELPAAVEPPPGEPEAAGTTAEPPSVQEPQQPTNGAPTSDCASSGARSDHPPAAGSPGLSDGDPPAAAQPSQPPADRPGSTDGGDAAGDSPETPPPPPDARLAAYVQYALSSVRPLSSDREQAATLAAFVAARLGGAVPREHLGTWSDEPHLCALKRRLRGNVIAVGDVERGGMRCRALLFKFLADQVGLPCSLNRGSGGRHWNTVLLRGEAQMALLGPYLDTVVDLMHEPGRLMSVDSADGVEYVRGFSSHQ